MFKRIRSFTIVTLAVISLSGCVAIGPNGIEANDTIRSYDQNSWQSNKALLRAAEESGNYELMVNTARNVVTRSPENQEARVFYAKALTKSGDAEQALRTLTSVDGKSFPGAHLEKARAMIALGDTAGALSELARFDETMASEKGAPVDAQTKTQLQRDALKLEAVAASLSGSFTKAQAIFESLMQEKDEPDVRFNYARTLLFIGKSQEALNLLQPIVGALPQAKFAAAVALIQLNRKTEARELLRTDMDDVAFEKLLKLHQAR
ncbi:MAG: tetratricopeptide repeat protein [Sutterellaceae bacterium]|nr:tetratricopeptide repeat protein [Sutterellaceae bacterium]